MPARQRPGLIAQQTVSNRWIRWITWLAALAAGVVLVGGGIWAMLGHWTSMQQQVLAG